MLLLLSYPSGELVCYVIKREKVKYHIRKPHHIGEVFLCLKLNNNANSKHQ